MADGNIAQHVSLSVTFCILLMTLVPQMTEIQANCCFMRLFQTVFYKNVMVEKEPAAITIGASMSTLHYVCLTVQVIYIFELFYS